MIEEIINRKWNSLNQLKDFIEQSNEIQVYDFNGWSLDTSVGSFRLSDGIVSIVDND